MSEPVLRPESGAEEVRPPLSPEAERWISEIDEEAASGELWKHPSIREQLAEHYKRAGLSE